MPMSNMASAKNMVSLYYLIYSFYCIPLICAGNQILNNKDDTVLSVEYVKNKTHEPTLVGLLKSSLLNIHEDADLAITDLVPKYGYPLEVHRVVTTDGYILTIHRIPNKEGPPILVFHGLLSSSDDWIITRPSHALGYALADAGYDVWLVNARGNKHSSRHINITTDEFGFWNFSFHEIGLYDLPATIDYILGMRNLSSLYYIGHSQGCTVFFILCSLRPEYNSKIKIMYALAPAVFNFNMTSPLGRIAASQGRIFELLQSYLSIGEVPFSKMIDYQAQGAQIVCNKRLSTEALCGFILSLTTGYNREEINDTMMPVLMGHCPSGASSKQMLHFSQFYRTGNFQWYDYGKQENYKLYNRATPPSYDLSKVSAPVYIMYSKDDCLIIPAAVEKLYKNLPNVVKVYLVPTPKFSHMDFAVGNSAKTVVYDVILKSMKSYL